MTLNVTLPDALYQRIADMASQQQVSVERIVAAAVSEQVAGWNRVERMAASGDRSRFLAALEKVPDADPIPGDSREAR